MQEQSNDELGIRVKAILPLREACTEVERLIINLALLRTQNTYNLAKLLGVNQSTVVRKLQRFGKASSEYAKAHESMHFCIVAIRLNIGI